MKLPLPAVLRAVEAFNHIGHMLVTRDTQRRVENLEKTVRYLKLAVNRHYGQAPLWTRDRRYVVGRKEFDDLYNCVGSLSAQLHNVNEAHNRVSSEVGILRNRLDIEHNRVDRLFELVENPKLPGHHHTYTLGDGEWHDTVGIRMWDKP